MYSSVFGSLSKRYLTNILQQTQNQDNSSTTTSTCPEPTNSNSSERSSTSSNRVSSIQSDSQRSRRVSSGLKPDRTSNSRNAEVQLNISGANQDCFILVPDILSYRELDLRIPFLSKPYRILDYWSDIKHALPYGIPVHPSSVGSLHDRACEIFYELKGGQVNYGKEHSRKFCHSQFGAYHEGLIPEWDSENPIVLVGKGYGAQTILYLQYLLATDYFKFSTNSSWVKGVISINGSLSGSTLPYLRGLIPGTKTVIHPLSMLQLLLGILHIFLWLDWKPLLVFLDLIQMEHWNLSHNDNSSLWSALFGRSAYAYFEDNFFHDYSVEGASWHSKLYHLVPNCVYLNYISDGSVKSTVTGHHLPQLSNWKHFFTGFRLGRMKFSPEIEKQILDNDSSVYWENNGYIPVKSQQPPSHHPVRFNVELRNKILDPVLYALPPGVWYNIYVHDYSYMRLHQKQEEFYSYATNASLFWKRFNSTVDATWIFIAESFESLSIKVSRSSPVRVFSLFLNRSISHLNEEDFEKASDFYSWDGPLGQNRPIDSPATTFNKFDVTAQAWARDTETRAFLQSPSSIIRWMNQNSNSTDSADNSQLSIDAQVIRRALEARGDHILYKNVSK